MNQSQFANPGDSLEDLIPPKFDPIMPAIVIGIVIGLLLWILDRFLGA
jgi:hypothetical protein